MRPDRRFGLELALGFALFGMFAWWRGHPGLATGLGVVAGLAAGAAMFAAPALAPLQRHWMAAGHALGRVTSPIFFGAIYLLVVTPIGVLRRTFGRSPLWRDPEAKSYWFARKPRTAEEARRAMERYF